MYSCPHREKRVLRVRRKLWEKILYSDMYVCSVCKRRMGGFHPALVARFRFVFSHYSHCIRCGSGAVQRLAKRDTADGFSNHVLARVQVLLGAPVNRCSPCRLQFFDWRKPFRLAQTMQASAEPVRNGGQTSAEPLGWRVR